MPRAASRYVSRRPDMFRGMFWPLIAGFIAFVLLAVILGWVMDSSRRDDGERH